eukprot:756886-Prymnesium_polylepis.1
MIQCSYTCTYQNDCVLRARELVSCARAIWSLATGISTLCDESAGQSRWPGGGEPVSIVQNTSDDLHLDG